MPSLARADGSTPVKPFELQVDKSSKTESLWPKGGFSIDDIICRPISSKAHLAMGPMWVGFDGLGLRIKGKLN